MAPARPLEPRLGRTPRPPSRRPAGPHDSLGGQLASPRPREWLPHEGGGAPHERGPHATPDLVALAGRFDSTLGFPGEPPPEIIGTPWFLTSVTTRDLMDAKRRRLTGDSSDAAPAVRRLDFPTASRRQSEGRPSATAARTDTALGRFLKAHKALGRFHRTNAGTPDDPSLGPGICMFARAPGLHMQMPGYPLPPVPV